MHWSRRAPTPRDSPRCELGCSLHEAQTSCIHQDVENRILAASHHGTRKNGSDPSGRSTLGTWSNRAIETVFSAAAIGVGDALLPDLATDGYSEWMSKSPTTMSLLRQLRKQQGASLRSAAAEIGIAPSQLSRLERGQRGLAHDVTERLSAYYGVPADVIAITNGEIPADVIHILREHPEEMARLRAQYGRRA